MAVWIKLSRVPSHCVTTRFGREFLPYFGELLDISLFGSRRRDAVFIKGLVRIDLLASFLGRRQACGPDNIPFWVRLHYENISSICYRCGFLGHASLRCPHTDIPLDHEARGSWMSIGRVGFGIMENSLQNYMQNQIKAKKLESENSDFGQYSFVTKEKKFGYTVQPLVDESGLDGYEKETSADAGFPNQSARPPVSKKQLKDGAKSLNGRCSAPSEGAFARKKQASPPQKSARDVMINKEEMVKKGTMKGTKNIYIHPGRRRLEGNDAFSCSKGSNSATVPPARPPLGPAGARQQQAFKRKLTFESKAKGSWLKRLHQSLQNDGCPQRELQLGSQAQERLVLIRLPRLHHAKVSSLFHLLGWRGRARSGNGSSQIEGSEYLMKDWMFHLGALKGNPFHWS
ncbi:hypothetical protein LINPERHAP2_LOCUS39172 [Linum perenne]